jgi:uncharacterized protein (TIGR03118 family)
MKQRLSGLARRPRPLFAVFSLVAVGSLVPIGAGAAAARAKPATAGRVLQTNLVSDLPGVAAVTDPNLVNSWGISESPGSPFWISDNNSGVATLYTVPGAAGAPVTTSLLVVSIPTPVALTGGTPTGTVFNTGSTGDFPITGPNKAGDVTKAGATFLFDTEDGTIVGWNPGIDPTHKFAGPNGVSTQAVIAVDNSGNTFTNPDPDQQTGAVYKGLAIATPSPAGAITSDAHSTSLVYATNFRAGTIEVYDTTFKQATGLPTGAFTDPNLPAGYAPFNVQVLNGKVYVTYARQDAAKHDDAAGPHRGFVDVFNLNGTPGLAHGTVRLVSRGPLDSPWGLAIAPSGFGNLGAPSNDPVLLVGNFGDGLINAFDASTGTALGQLKDPDGEPIQIDGLWALRVGNGGAGGVANAVYFTAGPFGESHGLFGSLTTATRGSPEGPAESQWVQANVDIVQLDSQQLVMDTSNGASPATIRQDTRTLDADTLTLLGVERAFTQDTRHDATH